MFDIPAQFKALKLYGMASCYAELRQQYTPDRMADFESADQILSQLLQAESTERNIPFHPLSDSSRQIPDTTPLTGV